MLNCWERVSPLGYKHYQRNCVHNYTPTLKTYENSSRYTPASKPIVGILIQYRMLRPCLTFLKLLHHRQ